MEINSIVYSKQYGFGKVIGFKNNFAITLFLEEEQKLILKTFLEEVEDEFLQFMKEEKYLLDFDKKVIQRGFEYNNSYAIKDVFFHDNSIKAEIIGTDDYYTSITFRNGKMSYSCSCPVANKHCKHAVALCMYVHDLLEEVAQLQIENTENNAELTEHLKDVVERYVISRSGISDLIYEILNDIENNLSMEYLVKFFKYISKIPASRINFSNVYRALGLNDKTREVLFNNLGTISRFGFYSDLKSAIGLGSRLSSEIKSGYPKLDDYNVDYYFYNHLYEQFIINALTQKAYYFRYDALLPKAIELTDVSSNLFNTFKHYLYDGRRVDSEAVRMLLEKLSLEQKAELYSDTKVALKPTYSQIADFPTELKMKLIPSLTIINSEIPMILDELKGKEIDNRLLAKILCNLKDFSSSESNINKIGEVAERLDNSELFVKYLTNNQTVGRFQSIPLNRDGNLLDENDRLDNDKELSEYFDTGYRIDETMDNYSIRLYLYSLTGRIAFSAILKDDGQYSCSTNEIDGYINHENCQKYINYILNAKDGELSVGLNEVKERIRKNRLREQYTRLSMDIDSLRNKFSNSIITLNSSRKAHLEYSFRLNSTAYLSLKVGIDKMYIIKNIYHFLENFRFETTEKYGKSLILTHRLSNFEDEDKEVLKQLTMFKFDKDYYGDSKELNINGNLLYSLLVNLKGKYVTVNDEQYYISLNKLEPEIFVDNDYVLHYSLSEERYKSYFIDNHIFVLDVVNRVINIVECSSKNYALFNFANRNNNSEIKEMIDVFKDEVYARYPEQITVAEKLKDQFKISLLEINAYFDYDSKKILLNTEFIKDDKKVEEDSLTKSEELNRLAIYKQYLSSIGFVDNELKDDAKVLTFFSMDLSELKDYCTVYLSESIKNKQVISFSPSTIHINYQNNMMQAFMEQSDFSDEELDTILKAIRRKKKYVQLTGDRIIDISDSSSKEFAKAVDDIGLDSKHLSLAKEISVINALKGYAHSENVSVDSYLSKMVDDIKSFKKNDMPVPEITGELRDYQKDGYRWMKILSDYHVGGILADDMGLGKTIQIICLIKGNEENLPNLIVCPKSLVFNWKNEFARFAQDQKVVEIYGNKDERAAIIAQMKKDEKCTYITSYDSLRNDLDDYKVDFNHLVIDEAQYIKNVTAQKTVSVKQLNAAHKFALTGTPIENNIIDLWSIFDFIMPGYLEELSIFKSNYSNYDEFAELVRRRVAPFILRRTKANVLKDLPEKFERVLTAEMSTEQKKLYDALAKQARDTMHASKGSFDVLPYLMRLRQVCVDPRTFVDGFEGTSGKMELLEETVKDYVNNDHKILIFSQFVKALNLVEQMLKDNDIPYFMITGDTDGKDRIQIAESFNSDSKEKVCLISLKAGGTGLNLIGADTVIHLDPWWNVSAENQATDRTHRIGQTKSVEVIKLICSNSIEQRVIELQNIKKDLIDRLISNDESSISNATLEDIEFILDY